MEETEAERDGIDPEGTEGENSEGRGWGPKKGKIMD